MQNSIITHNIIKHTNSATGDTTNIKNILTDKNILLFHHSLESLENILLFPIHINQERGGDGIDTRISYDLILSNNPVFYSTNINNFYKYHLKSIIYFHYLCENNFKKEDKFLLKQSISSCYKVFANQNIMHSWGFDASDSCSIIDYGINIPSSIDMSKKRSIVVFNTSDNSSIDNLYQHIKTVFQDAAIINSKTKPVEILKILGETAVCVNPEYYINSLFGIACRCVVITSKNEVEEDGLLQIHTYNNILQLIKHNLQQYDMSKAILNSSKILAKYHYGNFANSLIDTFNKIIREPFIYV